MKKLLAPLLLFISATVSATYIPVNGSTVNIQNVINPVQVSNSTIAVTQNSGPWSTTVANSTIAVSQNGAPWSATVANSTIGVTQSGVPWTVANSTIGVTGTVGITGSISNTSFAASNLGVFADSTNFTTAVTSVTPIAGVYQQIVTPVVSTGIYALRETNNRSLFVTPSDNNGVILGTATTNPIIIGHGGVAQPTTVANSTIAVAQNGAPWSMTVANSTIAVAQNGAPWSMTVANSTIAVAQNGAPWSMTVANSTIAVAQNGAPWSTTVANSTIGVTQSGVPWTIANSTTAVVGTLGDNGVAAGTNRVPTLPGIYASDYLDGTAATDDRNAALQVGNRDGLLRTAQLPDFTDTFYRASTSTFAMATSTGDFLAICGNGISTITVTGLRLSCTQTTAGMVEICVANRSTAYTAAWSTITNVPGDSSFAVAHSSAIFFTAFPHTDGTLVGYVDCQQIGCEASATATPNDIFINASDWGKYANILRGPSQCLGVNTQSQTVTGNKWTGGFSWIETISP